MYFCIVIQSMSWQWLFSAKRAHLRLSPTTVWALTGMCLTLTLGQNFNRKTLLLWNCAKNWVIALIRINADLLA
jgi:hypothetical protein